MNRLVLLFCVILFSSCSKDDWCNCLKSEGAQTTEIRDLPEFTAVELDHNIDLVVKQDTFYKVEVTCGKNLIDGISTEVNYGKLVLNNNNKCNWLRDLDNKFTVTITVKDLVAIENFGAGNINFQDTLHTNVFQIDNREGSGNLNLILDCNEAYLKTHTGPADIIASGKVNYCYVYCAGNGYFRGRQLESKDVYVQSVSTGNCYVNASNSLTVRIEYDGDVYYTGNPATIESVISGNGQLIKE